MMRYVIYRILEHATFLAACPNWLNPKAQLGHSGEPGQEGKP